MCTLLRSDNNCSQNRKIHMVGTTKFTIISDLDEDDEDLEDLEDIEDWEDDDFEKKYFQFIADFVAKFYEVVRLSD